MACRHAQLWIGAPCDPAYNSADAYAAAAAWDDGRRRQARRPPEDGRTGEPRIEGGRSRLLSLLAASSATPPAGAASCVHAAAAAIYPLTWSVYFPPPARIGGEPEHGHTA